MPQQYSQEQIRAELERRGALPPQQQGPSQEEIRAELERRGVAPQQEQGGGVLGGIGEYLSGLKEMTVGEDVPSLSEIGSGFKRFGQAMLNQPGQTAVEAARIMFVDPARARLQQSIERAEQAGFEGRSGVAPVLGGALSTGVSAVPFLGPAVSEIGETAIAEGNIPRALGQTTGLLAPVAAGRAMRGVRANKMTPLKETGVEFPLYGSERPGATTMRGPRRFIEQVGRSSLPGRGKFERADVMRQEALFSLADDVVDSVARGGNMDPASAGTAFQRSLDGALNALKETAGENLGAVEAANASVPVVPRATRTFARQVLGAMEESTKMGTVRGQNELISSVRKFANGEPVSFEAAAFLRKLANDSSRAVADNPLPGVGGGLAKKFAQTITEDIASSLEAAAPGASRPWLQASSRYRVAARRLEDQVFQRLLKVDPERVPDALARVDVRQIPRIKTIVGKEKFDRAAAALLNDAFAKSTRYREMLPTRAAEQGLVIERQLTPGPLQTWIRNMERGGRMEKIFGEAHARQIRETFTVAETLASTMRVGTGRLISAWIDKALIFGVPSAAAGAVIGLPVATPLLAGGLGTGALLSIASKVMTDFKGATALRNVARAAAKGDTQAYGVALLSLRNAIEESGALKEVQSGRQEPQQ